MEGVNLWNVQECDSFAPKTILETVLVFPGGLLCVLPEYSIVKNGLMEEFIIAFLL